MNSKNLLLTGVPGCGKSTLIENIVKKIPGPVRGFITREIRSKGERVGFRILTLDGKEGVLAHKDSPSLLRVGRYGVNVDQLEKIALPAMEPANPEEVVVIDEIGKMECLSLRFRETLRRLLDSENRVIGSIALKGDPFIQRIKQRPDVLLVQVTEKNRNSLADALMPD